MTIFATITSVTLRALLGRRRTLLMVLLASMPILLGLIVRANDDDLSLHILGQTIDGIVTRTVLPLVAIVFGTAALGSELEDGTGVHFLTKPIDRWLIVVAKTIVAGSLTAVLLVPSTVISGFLMGGLGATRSGSRSRSRWRSSSGRTSTRRSSSSCRCSRRAGLLIGLGYAIIWEGIVAGLLPGSQVFSVREYLSGIVTTFAPDALPASSVGSAGFLYAAVAFVLALAIGSLRLARYEVRGAE